MRSNYRGSGVVYEFPLSTVRRRLGFNNPYSFGEGIYNDDNFNNNYIPGLIEDEKVNKDDQGEVPLLEELEINPDKIRDKVRYVLGFTSFERNFRREEYDLLGPLIIVLFYFIALYLRSKSAISYFYLNLLLGEFFLCSLINLMSGQDKISFYNSISILCYCLLPISLYAYFSVLFTLESVLGCVISLAVVSYCSFLAMTLFTSHLGIKNKDWLIMYPLSLYYLVFILLLL